MMRRMKIRAAPNFGGSLNNKKPGDKVPKTDQNVGPFAFAVTEKVSMDITAGNDIVTKDVFYFENNDTLKIDGSKNGEHEKCYFPPSEDNDITEDNNITSVQQACSESLAINSTNGSIQVVSKCSDKMQPSDNFVIHNKSLQHINNTFDATYKEKKNYKSVSHGNHNSELQTNSVGKCSNIIFKGDEVSLINLSPQAESATDLKTDLLDITSWPETPVKKDVHHKVLPRQRKSHGLQVKKAGRMLSLKAQENKEPGDLVSCADKEFVSLHRKDSCLVKKNGCTLYSSLRRKQMPLSHKYKERKVDCLKKMNRGTIERTNMTMFDLIFYNPTSNPMPTSASVTSPRRHHDERQDQAEEEEEQETEEHGLVEGSEKDSVPDSTPTSPAFMSDDDSNPPPILAPRVKIDENGKIIVDEKSLMIQTSAVKKRDKIMSNLEVIEESSETSYSRWNKKRRRSHEWTRNETARFYKALSSVGTDFSLMSALFPWRTRDELKMKFKREERLNHHLIESALVDSTQFDFSVFDESDYDPEEDRKSEAKRKQDEIKKEKLQDRQLRQQERKEIKIRKEIDRKRKKKLKEMFKSRQPKFKKLRKKKKAPPPQREEDTNEALDKAISLTIAFPMEACSEIVSSLNSSIPNSHIKPSLRQYGRKSKKKEPVIVTVKEKLESSGTAESSELVPFVNMTIVHGEDISTVNPAGDGNDPLGTSELPTISDEAEEILYSHDNFELVPVDSELELTKSSSLSQCDVDLPSINLVIHSSHLNNSFNSDVTPVVGDDITLTHSLLIDQPFNENVSYTDASNQILNCQPCDDVVFVNDFETPDSLYGSSFENDQSNLSIPDVNTEMSSIQQDISTENGKCVNTECNTGCEKDAALEVIDCTDSSSCFQKSVYDDDDDDDDVVPLSNHTSHMQVDVGVNSDEIQVLSMVKNLPEDPVSLLESHILAPQTVLSNSDCTKDSSVAQPISVDEETQDSVIVDPEPKVSSEFAGCSPMPAKKKARLESEKNPQPKLWQFPISSIVESSDGRKFIHLATRRGTKRIPIPQLDCTTTHILVMATPSPENPGQNIFHVYGMSVDEPS